MYISTISATLAMLHANIRKQHSITSKTFTAWAALKGSELINVKQLEQEK